MTKPISIPTLTRSCYLGMFVFGIVFTILGAILPFLLQSRNVSVAQAGSLFFFLNLGSLVAVLVSGPLLDWSGYRSTLVLSPFLIGVSFVMLGVGQTYPVLALACWILGLGGGALNNATNSFVSDLHPHDRTVALNRLGMFFCIGAIFIPLLMGSLLAVLGIQKIILAATAVALLPALLFWMPAFPEAKQRERVSLQAVFEVLAHPFVLFMGILFFFESGGEFSSGGWITSFFISARGLSNREASWILALLWLSVMVGRLSVGIWLQRIPEIRFVFLSAFGGALCWLLLLYSRVLALQILAVFLLGYCLAGIFPTCLSIAGARFPKNSGAVFGALFAVGTLGGMTVPYTVGQIASSKGIASGMAILPFCAAAVAILSRWVTRAPAGQSGT